MGDEIFKDIWFVDSKYKISNCGNIISYKTGNKIILKPKTDKDGYLVIGLRNTEGKRKFFRVHRLVAMIFIGIPSEDKNIVNHIDGNVRNNHVSNLEWCDITYNNIHRFKLGYRVNGNKIRVITKDEAIEIFKLKASKLTEHSQRCVAEKYGVSKGVIASIWNKTGYQNYVSHLYNTEYDGVYKNKQRKYTKEDIINLIVDINILLENNKITTNNLHMLLNNYNIKNEYLMRILRGERWSKYLMDILPNKENRFIISKCLFEK